MPISIQFKQKRNKKFKALDAYWDYNSYSDLINNKYLKFHSFVYFCDHVILLNDQYKFHH